MARMNSPDAAFRLEVNAVDTLRTYAAIPSRYRTQTAFEVGTEDGAFTLQERALPAPFDKDYDELESPLQWPRLFDVSRWAMVSAFAGTRLVGGAIVAYDTPGLDMLEGRRDLAVLWDIRVHPDAHGQGVGTALFCAVKHWSIQRGAETLRIETQNVNVAACRFYRAMGCRLVAAEAGAYPALPGETKLLWEVALERQVPK
jgi:ribosomal protein S18 acetylase RimI-like enzyme